jgi:hypothetical protein
MIRVWQTPGYLGNASQTLQRERRITSTITDQNMLVVWIATAIFGRAEVRAAFQHLARNFDLRLAWVIAAGLGPAARIFDSDKDPLRPRILHARPGSRPLWLQIPLNGRRALSRFAGGQNALFLRKL